MLLWKMVSERMKKRTRKRSRRYVLILVVVEDGLRDDWYVIINKDDKTS